MFSKVSKIYHSILHIKYQYIVSGRTDKRTDEHNKNITPPATLCCHTMGGYTNNSDDEDDYDDNNNDNNNNYNNS